MGEVRAFLLGKTSGPGFLFDGLGCRALDTGRHGAHVGRNKIKLSSMELHACCPGLSLAAAVACVELFTPLVHVEHEAVKPDLDSGGRHRILDVVFGILMLVDVAQEQGRQQEVEEGLNFLSALPQISMEDRWKINWYAFDFLSYSLVT